MCQVLFSLSGFSFTNIHDSQDSRGRGLKFQPLNFKPLRSTKGPNVQDPQGTFSGLLGDQQKIDNLMKNVLFRCNSSWFTHLLLFFTGKTNMQKF